MQLARPSISHITEMMSWFPNEQALLEWSGPNFHYPFSLTTFTQDLKLDEMYSYALVSNEGHFLAFGQYYQRLGKCHLARLVVSPIYRGKGISAQLITLLCESGLKSLNVKVSSLFVLTYNHHAINAYKKSGFIFVNYPEKMPLTNCLYMVKP